MSASRFALRDAGAGDFEALLALNNAAVPAVNLLAMEDLQRIASLACWMRVAEVERDAEEVQGAGAVLGFVLCIPSGTDYWSANYRWFAERHDSFLYLDRVVVDDRARGQGVGAALYDEMHAFAATRWPRVGLEVNLRPPNPGSDRFHRRLGYVAVGVREYDDGAVTMYARPLLPTRPGSAGSPPAPPGPPRPAVAPSVSTR